MRLWHIAVAVAVVAVLLTVAREESSRVALIVFATGLVEFALATGALMVLFRTVGAIGQAEEVLGYAGAVLATAGVLVVASATMNAVLWVGLSLLRLLV